MIDYLNTDELHAEWQDLVTRVDDDETTAPLDEEETCRCKELGDLFAQIGESSRTLIAASSFEEYAEELAADVIGVDTGDWPMNRVDWAAAADDLMIDYVLVTFDGTEYLYR